MHRTVYMLKSRQYCMDNNLTNETSMFDAGIKESERIVNKVIAEENKKKTENKSDPRETTIENLDESFTREIRLVLIKHGVDLPLKQELLDDLTGLTQQAIGLGFDSGKTEGIRIIQHRVNKLQAMLDQAKEDKYGYNRVGYDKSEEVRAERKKKEIEA
jgi:hypothetical protein